MPASSKMMQRMPCCHGSTSPGCWQGNSPTAPQEERPHWTYTVSRAERANGQAAAPKLARVQPGTWLDLRKLFFIQSHRQWLGPAFGKWGWEAGADLTHAAVSLRTLKHSATTNIFIPKTFNPRRASGVCLRCTERALQPLYYPEEWAVIMKSLN